MTPHYQNNTHQHNQRWQSPWSQIPSDIVSLADYERAVRQHLPSQIQALLFENSLGSGSQLSDRHLSDRALRKNDSNAAALDGYQWLPRVLRPQPVHLNCRLYNPDSAVPVDIQLSHPLWLSPVAHQGLYHPQAELATLQAAKVMSTPAIFSGFGNTPFSQILPKANIGTVQWYWQPTNSQSNSIQARREYNLELINALIDNGMQLLVLTVDAPHSGVRAVSRRLGAQLPEYCQAVNIPTHLQGSSSNQSLKHLLEQAPTWEDIAWLVARCKVPVMLKGILHPEDAQLAKDCGCAGIIASNHGRRVLSDVVPVATCLSKLRAQVGDNMIIIADGGVSSGSDMAKLIALGADAVGIGRGYIYGLAMAGALGVAHVIKLLLEELEVTMAVLGVSDITGLNQASLIQS